MPKPRGQQKKTVKAKIHIFCEGAKTEPNYIRAYIEIKHPTVRSLKSENQPVRIVNTSKNTPKQLVDEASKFVQSLENASDQVWVVYDRESPRKHTDSVHADARNMALANGVHIAFSNVCFELWLLLHFKYAVIGCDMCDDVIRHKYFKDAMKEIDVDSYAKGQANVASLIISQKGTDTAKANAIATNAATIASSPEEDEDKPYKLRPYTDVYKLLDEIDKIAAA
jgi:hypothetical protein